jgi:hypothetical protein
MTMFFNDAHSKTRGAEEMGPLLRYLKPACEASYMIPFVPGWTFCNVVQCPLNMPMFRFKFKCKAITIVTDLEILYLRTCARPKLVNNLEVTRILANRRRTPANQVTVI